MGGFYPGGLINGGLISGWAYHGQARRRKDVQLCKCSRAVIVSNFDINDNSVVPAWILCTTEARCC